MRGRAFIVLLAAFVSIAALAASSARVGTVEPLRPDPGHCKGDGRPYQGVYCRRNHNPGGRTGCFLSPCEAHAVGAFDCFRIDTCK